MEQKIGRVTHYYNRLGVAVLDLNEELKVGDVIHILGHTTNSTQPVESLEIEHDKVQAARSGEEVAIKVMDRVRKGDILYKIIEQ